MPAPLPAPCVPSGFSLQTARGTEAGGPTVSPGGQTAPRNRGWWSDRHPGRSDRLTLRSSSVACFTNLDRLPCTARDFGCTPRGTHDSGRITCDSSIPAIPAALLASPSGYAGATGTASTSAVATSKGYTGGLSGQPSSDDHAGEAGVPASDRQTHPVGHFGVDLVTGALLRPCRPRQSKLAPWHGRRICCPDCQ
jgi:hypothetical protein